jgi:hypothetical protein
MARRSRRHNDIVVEKRRACVAGPIRTRVRPGLDTSPGIAHIHEPSREEGLAKEASPAEAVRTHGKVPDSAGLGPLADPATIPLEERGMDSTGVHAHTEAPLAPAFASTPRETSPPFRFYDNRQKYLAFVNTCNEKAAVARRIAQEMLHVRPQPPALRIFDAGMGDATVLSRIMRSTHRLFPTVPLLAVAKEISLEDVRLGLEKMPDRFVEHPATVLVITNLNYTEAPRLMLRDAQAAAALNWQQVDLVGSSAHDYAEQIEALAPMLAHGWQTRRSEVTGNPVYVRPSVLVLCRKDHRFVLDQVLPRPGSLFESYDFILACQPWRARMSAQFKASRVLAPLVRSLAPGGRLLGVQSAGRDPALEIVQKLWPGENPFEVDRHALLAALKAELGREAREYTLSPLPDDKAIFRYEMHTLPSEIGDRISTSTIFAAWNAAIYVNQIEDERLESVVEDGTWRDAVQSVLHRHGGLWFNDETFVVTRRKS